jgi:hypothetical protein
MDDLLIFSRTLEENQAWMERVLHLFRENNLFLKAKKCTFDTMTVEYLGLIIENGQVQMDPVKTNAITDWPTPTTKKELQSFLGFMNFYCWFIKDFAKVAALLNKLTGKTDWTWEEDQQWAFNTLKKIVTSSSEVQGARTRR